MKMLVQIVTLGSNVRYIGATEHTFHAGYWLITWDRGADEGARYHATNDQTFIATIESHLVQWEPLGKPYIAEMASLPWDENRWFSNILREAEWSGYIVYAAGAVAS